MIEPPQGDFIFGSQSYTSDLVPVIVKASKPKAISPIANPHHGKTMESCIISCQH